MSGDFVSVIGITEDCDKGGWRRLGPCQRAPPDTLLSADLPELLAQSQALHLIGRSYADTVYLFRRFQQSHVG